MAGAKKEDKHVLVRMPAELHERIRKISKSHRVPRSFNTELVELLYEFTDWWGDGETATSPDEGQLEAIELTAKKMLANARSARAHKKVPWK
jgi:Arc-like DNA binding domain